MLEDLLGIGLISDTLTTILEPTAKELGEKLANKLFKDRNSSSSPALPKEIEESDPYKQKLICHPVSKSRERGEDVLISSAGQFSAQLLELLKGWQTAQNARQIEDLLSLSTPHKDTNEAIKLLQHEYSFLIFTAPPDMSMKSERFLLKDEISQRIRNDVGEFLQTYYPETSDHPVRFNGDHFLKPIEQKGSIMDVHRLLSSIPSAVIYSDINETSITFHIGCWIQKDGEIAYFSLKRWNWRDAYDGLIEQYPQYPRQKHREAIHGAVIKIYQLLAAFLADWYYLNVDLLYKPKSISAALGEQLLFGRTTLFRPFATFLHEVYQTNQSEFFFDQGMILAAQGRSRESVDSFVQASKIRQDLEGKEWEDALQKAAETCLGESKKLYTHIFNLIKLSSSTESALADKLYSESLNSLNDLESQIKKRIDNFREAKRSNSLISSAYARPLGYTLEFELASSKEIDYTELQKLLVNGEWKDANCMTDQIVRYKLSELKCATDEYTKGAVQRISCVDLHTIDQLWMKCSGGRFGITAQRQIYGSGDLSVKELCERLGWIRGKELNYSLIDKFPQGGLPTLIWTWSDGWFLEWAFGKKEWLFLELFDTCKLSYTDANSLV